MPLIIAEILLFILCSAFTIQLIFWYFGCFRFAFSIHNSQFTIHNSQLPPASVIICARNEAANIKRNLIFVLEQDYPVFEVIVVDDCSYDNTMNVLKEIETLKVNKYPSGPKLKVLQIKEDDVYKHGKKLALTIAIKSAQYEHLVFTDADCYPATKNWLQGMVETFDEKTEIVLGYGAYQKTKGFVNKLIRMDTFRIGLQYLSFAIAGVPYMGIGRNMAYRKSFFLKQKGFSPHSHIPSGDDDLFVNKAATRFNIRIAVSPDCITFSEPKKSLGDWLRQKRRHVSTFKYYTKSSKILLGTLTLSQYLFWIAAVFLIFNFQFSIFNYMALSLILLYLIIQLLIYRKATNRMGEKKLFVYSLLLEWFILFIFYPLVAISNLLFKHVAWKT